MSNVTTLEHLSYSRNIAAADLYLFPRLKSALKGRGFCDASDISRNATEELKRLSQYCFQGSSVNFTFTFTLLRFTWGQIPHSRTNTACKPDSSTS